MTSGKKRDTTVPDNVELAVGEHQFPTPLTLNTIPIAAKDQIGLLKDFKFVKVADQKYT